ncbi:MAG: PEGA domain-containing protein [Myxococcales bacterium]|nr:PEGA domain-containing protein [Myxococcales bacterium]
MFHPTTTSLCTATLLLSLSSIALAQESASDKAAADALFDDAKKLMAAEKWDEACPKLAESLKLSQRLGTLLNLANCHAEQGKTASAWAEFNEAAAIAKRDKSKQREKFARTHVQQLEKRLARVSFKLPNGLEGATLEIDGTAVGTSALGTALPIDPGTHEVKVSAPGKKTWTKQLHIEGEARTTTVEVPALEAEEAAPAAAAEKAPTSERAPTEKPAQKASPGGGSTLGWVALGVGVVGVGVGSYFGLKTFSKKNESKDQCGEAIGQSDPNRCTPQGVDLRDDAKSAATFSTIGFAVGAVGVGAGVVLLLSSGGSAPEKSARRTQFVPMVGPRGGGLGVSGAF